jgi:hypothetical protein
MSQRLKGFLKRYTRHESMLFYLALSYMALFWVLVEYFLPPFIRDDVIAPVVTLIATVEGIFVALSPQIRIKSIRDWVAVGVGVPALMLSLITATIAYYQSIQLHILSQDLESIVLFRFDAFLFVLLVGFYAIGVLFSRQPEDQPEAKGATNNNPESASACTPPRDYL